MPEKTLAWIKEIDIEDLLEKDPKLVFESCGIDMLICLWENFQSIPIYMSTVSLDRLRKRYIKKYFTGSNAKELCQKLNCSERFFYKVLEEKSMNTNQLDLFSDNKGELVHG